LAAHSEKKTYLTANYGGKNMTDSTFWGKPDWEHILGKDMIHSTFWKKKRCWQHILGKKHD
jgi:hypothetical protein